MYGIDSKVKLGDQLKNFRTIQKTRVIISRVLSEYLWLIINSNNHKIWYSKVTKYYLVAKTTPANFQPINLNYVSIDFATPKRCKKYIIIAL